MSDKSNVQIDISFIAVIILIILCVGKPDLLDAIIHRVQYCGENVEVNHE